jgi:hypothetical protein
MQTGSYNKLIMLALISFKIWRYKYYRDEHKSNTLGKSSNINVTPHIMGVSVCVCVYQTLNRTIKF